MNKKLILSGICLAATFFTGCQKEKADAIYTNGIIYQVDSTFSKAEAFAVKNGKFLSVGSSDEILSQYESDKMIDLNGNPVYPGFYDAHCHFVELGNVLQTANLVGTKSFSEILEKLKGFRTAHPAQAWLEGRGWDQNDWEDKSFPTKDSLDILFPDVPVILTRIDGHAVLVNSKALELGGVDEGTKVEGGKVVLENGQPTGILVDNAANLVIEAMPDLTEAQLGDNLKIAEELCFQNGITTVADAGLRKKQIDFVGKMHDNGNLKIRMYAMAHPADTSFYFGNGPVKTDRLNVTSFKIYADGALGSRGACLLHPYHDDPDNSGFLLESVEDLRNLVKAISLLDFQANTHCIGDSANRALLDIYGEVLKGENDKRWRIEHAQVVSSDDMEKFAKYNVIPSVQPTHATSDMYWAEDRLGKDRIKTAYAYKTLLEQNGMLAIGSDFPVEDVNPLYGFHAAVARQDGENYPEEGFQMENAISREDALRGMTIWAAYAQFEENENGSIEEGKKADFVILSEDIMTAPNEKLRDVKVMNTIVGGEEVFTQQKLDKVNM
ncbi:amidohydrolase [Limibacter armeniacum]|uniref:amidohydrolase n=1 Tax=Limibacter armeniacum TaxID=466084 RepID=UPI002FE588BA